MKIFVVGFPKSGTSTLHKAFTETGLSSAHWAVRGGYVGQIIYRDFLGGGDPLASFRGYDCITQSDVCLPHKGINFWPNLDFALLNELRERHPETLFLLNYRDPSSTARSILKWNDLAMRICQSDIPGLPSGYGGSERELAKWIENHFRTVRRFFSGDRKFLEIDVNSPDAPAQLSDGLGTTLKWWGIANANPSNGDARAARLGA